MFLLAVGASGQDDGATRLESLREEIRILSEKVEAAGGKEASLVTEIQRLDQLAELHRKELTILTRRMSETERRANASEERMTGLDSELAEHRRELAGRARDLKHIARFGYLGVLVVRPGEDGLPTALRQLSYLAGKDRRRVAALSERIDNIRRIQEGLGRSRSELETLRSETVAAERAMQGARTAKSRFLENVRSEKKEAESLRSELESAAERLQQMLGGFHAGPGLPTVPIHLYKGELQWPVRGKVTQGFGRKKGTRFDIPYPGVDIWAPLGTQVQAIAAGEVVRLRIEKTSG